MQNIKVSRSFLISWIVLILCLSVLTFRLFAPPDLFGDSTWVEFFFLLVLYVYVHLTALGIGWMVVRRFRLVLTDLELLLLAYMLGFGILSGIVALTGFLGRLTPPVVLVSLALSGVIASFAWQESLRGVWTVLRSLRFTRVSTIHERLLLILILLTIPVLLTHVLTPVWDYDALLYHLEVPRRYIAHGGIYFDRDVMRSAYPYLGEMLFAVGIMFRLDVLSKLVHLTYAVLFVAGVYAFAARFFNRGTGLTAVGILLSVPSFVLWSTWASIDFAWAGYELWGVYAVSMWLSDENHDSRSLLILAGIMSGFAASTKYISVPVLVLLAILIAWFSVSRLRKNFGETIQSLLIFGLSAGLVMGSWYIKNLILTGNPVYPLVYGGPGWEPLEDMVLNAYVQTFGFGKTLLDFIRLPYTTYVFQDRFSTISQEIIHPLLWLAFLFPFLTRSRKHTFVTAYTMTYFVWWFFSSQVIRFLLPLSAFLALFAGAVIEKFPSMLRNVLKFSLISGLLIFNLVYQTLTLRNSGAFGYIAGQNSAVEFLRLFVDDYSVKQYIQETFSSDERALFLWDGRGYYCDERCIADTEQSIAVGLALDSPAPEELSEELRGNGITHLMLSSSDADFFIKFHDPAGFHGDAWDYYRNVFLPTCGRSVFRDGGMELFEIDCADK